MFLGFSFFFVRLNHVAEYVFIGLVLIWIVEKLRTRDFHVRRTFLDVPILLFLVWVLVTVIFSVDPDYSFKEWRKALPRFLIFWFVIYTINTENQVRSVLFASSVGAGTLSLFEVTYYLWSGGQVFDFSMSMASRAGVFTGSSQWLSTYLVMGFPIVCLGLWGERVKWVRFVYMLLVGSMLGAALLVHTRAAWVAFAIELMVLGLVSTKYIRRITGLLGLFGLFLIFIFSSIGDRSFMTELQVANPISLQTRFNTWEFAIAEMVEQPRLSMSGVGYGKHSFNKAYPDLGAGHHTHIHNMFLARAIQLGIPGLLLFVWIFWMVVVKSFRGFHYFPHLYVGKLALAMLLATTGLMVRNLLDDMFMGSVVYVYCLFLGLLCVTLRLHGIGSKDGNIAMSPNRIPAADGRSIS
ncbi:MAG: O-antigen ligase family protein [Nitrospirales bacterium]